MARKVKLDWRHKWQIRIDKDCDLAECFIIHCASCPNPVEYIVLRSDFVKLWDNRRTSIHLIPRQIDFTEEVPDGARQDVLQLP